MNEYETPPLAVEPAVQATTVPGFWDANSKTMFFTGLFLGLAISASLGLALTLGAMWSGKPLGATASAANTNTVAAAPTPSQPATPPANPVKAVDAQDHVIGNKDAKVTLIEYSDFQCPYCYKFEASLKQALQKYPKDVRLIFRHYPLTQIHEYAQKAAEASECVAKLGGNSAFWKMHDKLFAITGVATDKNVSAVLTDDVLLAAAADSGVDKKKVKTCLDNSEMKSVVEADYASGNDAGVQGTPSTFVNGNQVSGALPFAAFEKELTAAGAKQ